MKMFSYIICRTAFVGETTAGKTSLVQSLILGRSHLTDVDDRTQVVNIKEWPVSETQIIMIFDQGGHPVYEICNPYFITERSTILIAHKLSDPSMTARTKQVFRHILHQHPGVSQLHFVLTHIDELDKLSEVQREIFSSNFKATIQKLLTIEIENIQRLIRSPNCFNIENLNRTLESCNSKMQSIQSILHIQI